MAYLVKIDPNNAIGKETLDALESISTALATLRKREGLRAATMNTSLSEFSLTFGVTANAQAFSDRLGALNAGAFTGLMDTVSEVVADLT
jgi:hypothetical protein